jgi:hypothetical protein
MYHPEIQEWEQEDEADEAPDHSVYVLEPKDRLESFDGHADVDIAIFRRLAILLEYCQPLHIVEGRQQPGRPPLDHREARPGQARQATDDHDSHDQRAAGE